MFKALEASIKVRSIFLERCEAVEGVADMLWSLPLEELETYEMFSLICVALGTTLYYF